jgi:UTP:GlnB (protein PII) uridylyltransferase
MAEKLYVFDHFLFVSRRGQPPNQWVWEIRRKSKPDSRYFTADGFRSAKAAEEAGKVLLAEVRKAALEDHAAVQEAKAAERQLKIAKRIEIAATKANRNTPECRSEMARTAAQARAKALSPERRSEISRMGGAASKGSPKIKKH